MLSYIGIAQDIHFSQFVQSPLTINPASAGAFEGTLRASGIFRKQWRSVTIPYNTFGMACDAKDIADVKNLNTGVNFFYDQAGDGHYSTMQINLAGAWSVAFDRERKKYLNFGLQANFTQRSIDYSKFTFNDQYVTGSGNNGGFIDPSLPAGEGFSKSTITYPDINAGVYYNWQPKKRKRISTGLSLYNITRPHQSFYGDSQIRLDRRLNIHADGLFKTGQKTDILPQMLFMKQGSFYELTLGGMGKYTLNSSIYQQRALYAGIYTRVKDAAYVTVGMDYNELYVGLSYDLNYSKLTPASRGRGGWELAVVYIIGKMPDRMKYRTCPDFM